MIKAFVSFLIVFALTNVIAAQSNNQNNIPDAPAYTCEDFSARVDSIYNVAKNSEKKVFVIFHAGQRESEIINFRRLNYVRDFLEINKFWEKLDVIYARGDKSKEKPIVAFYVDGKLMEAMSAPNNMTPCMDCCEARYYMPQSLLKPINFKSIKARDNRRTYPFP